MGQLKNSELAQQVLGYFMRYPNATDSLEGIVYWRLQEERVHRMVEETKSALEWLVEQGFLLQESSTPPVYRLNPEMHGRAATFLKQSGS